MFEMFLYLVATIFVLWLTSTPNTEVNTISEKLNFTEEVSSLADGIKSLEIHQSPPVTSAPHEAEVSDLSPYYSWVRSRKIAQENFCRLDNFRLPCRSYA